jgi:hypothetical protein
MADFRSAASMFMPGESDSAFQMKSTNTASGAESIIIKSWARKQVRDNGRTMQINSYK